MDITLLFINLLIIALSFRGLLFNQHIEQFLRWFLLKECADARVSSTGVGDLSREARLVAAGLVLDLAVAGQEAEAALHILLRVRLSELVGQVVLVVCVAVDVYAFHGHISEIIEATIKWQLVSKGLKCRIGRGEGPSETLIVLVVLLPAAVIEVCLHNLTKSL